MEVLCFFTLNKLIILLEWSSSFTPFILRIKAQTEYVLDQRVGSLFLMYRTNCLDIYYIHLSNISHQLLVWFNQRSSFFIWSGEIFLQCRDNVKKLLLYGQEKVWENHGDASTNTSPTLKWDISWLAACATDPQSGAGQPHASLPSSAQELFSPTKINLHACIK